MMERTEIQIGDYASIGDGVAGVVTDVGETSITIVCPERHNGKDFFVTGKVGCTRLVPIEWVTQA